LPEWDLQEVRNLKAFIAYDAIVDPGHPLSTGKGGAELYLGEASSVCTPPLSLACTLRFELFLRRIYRHSSEWREEAYVQLRSDRVHPVLVARDETHEGANRAPLVRIPHPNGRPPARLFCRLQNRSGIQESSEGTSKKSRKKRKEKKHFLSLPPVVVSYRG